MFPLWLKRQQICLVILYSQVAVISPKSPVPPEVCSRHAERINLHKILQKRQISSQKQKSERLFSPLKSEKSPLLLHCRVRKKHPEHLIFQISFLFLKHYVQKKSQKSFEFTPNAHRPGTAGCPRNRLWTCVCCVCGASCARCSVSVRGKVFVSPSPGPSVCCVSAGCAWCCGSSTGRRPDPGRAKRDPRPVRPMRHIREVTLESPTLRI